MSGTATIASTSAANTSAVGTGTTDTGASAAGPTGSRTARTARERTATVLAVLLALGIGYVGLSYLFAPESTVSGFGLPEWPHGGATAFFDVKGIRDLAPGIAILALLATGHRRALGMLLLADALVPLDDALNVLSHHGSAAAAYGIHGATAVAVALTGTLLLTERRPSV
ncbi:DUF4267 domain-containing protein [Streptomyces sp. CB01881]|uniref:DUF4267 domain-containing protein n=1 Tax=Streptomyces sp. CB01881 TaxID=2078691 RepID=UPI000CDC33A4|nr:DUF4267 domain-containing protein [Streptomyces sp. CB01881]AUY48692.1 small membrane hydrophobic protein [Streptomyces sp. CB01881]TYC77184.1 DUF4267 domain-containing protein [Streptomyces sp. CB01881]